MILPANTDKPHRCPTCWRIPDEARMAGGAIENVVYTCAHDGTRWCLRSKVAPSGPVNR